MGTRPAIRNQSDFQPPLIFPPTFLEPSHPQQRGGPRCAGQCIVRLELNRLIEMRNRLAISAQLLDRDAQVEVGRREDGPKANGLLISLDRLLQTIELVEAYPKPMERIRI